MRQTDEADLPAGWIVPDWPAPPGVRALITTRSGGLSEGPWGLADGRRGGMNLGYGSEDRRETVADNRRIVRTWLPAEPRWLRQEHGSRVVEAEAVGEPVAADAYTALAAGTVCAVLVADCMPVLLADSLGRGVAVAHAGWRGLSAGILQSTAGALRQRLADPGASLLAYLGPCIGPDRFQVGSEVLQAMRRYLPAAADAFRPDPATTDRWLADLPRLAKQALAQAGVDAVWGGTACTVSSPQRFYSYRRDRVTGRHAALIWRDPSR